MGDVLSGAARICHNTGGSSQCGNRLYLIRWIKSLKIPADQGGG